MEYRVPTYNKFESSLLDSDQDPFDVLAEQVHIDKEKSQLTKKEAGSRSLPSKSSQNQKKVTKKSTDAPLEKKSGSSGALGTRSGKISKAVDRKTQSENLQLEERSDKQPVAQPENKRAVSDSGSQSIGQGFGQGFGRVRDGVKRTDRPERARGRGGRGGRGGGRGAQTPIPSMDDNNSGKRDFDRHSGSDRTGVKSIEKRDGFGSHNWGTMDDDVQGQLNDTNLSEDNNPQIANIENLDPNKSTDERTDEPKEEDVTELTLDEWKAKQKEIGKPKPEFNIRQANEGTDTKQWKNTYVLRKKVDSDSEQDEEEEEIERKQLKAAVPIEITFTDSRRGGRGGAGRGRRPPTDRGGRISQDGRDGRPKSGRGGFNNKRQDVPKPDDKEAFPDLPGKA